VFSVWTFSFGMKFLFAWNGRRLRMQLPLNKGG
jgi:hypothetical protein